MFESSPNGAQQARLNLFNHIHQIIYHGNGGYDFNTVYNIPIWLRKYIYKEIRDFNNSASQPPEVTGEKTLIGKDGKINTPAFAKASQPYKGKSSYK